jgi:hypothetical protein
MLQYITPTILALGALGAQDQNAAQNGPPVFSIHDLGIQHYEPIHVPAWELMDLASGMVGRTFYLDERGGHMGDSIENLTMVGESLLLYDTSDYLVQMMAALELIDLPRPVEPEVEEDLWETFHYTPRYLSMEDMWSILENFGSNLSMAGERRIVVVQDEASTVREIKTLLEQVDVPEDQILVTAYLVRGWQTNENGTPLPAELAEHLGRLVPGIQLEAAGFAMLQSSVRPRADRDLSLQLSGSAPLEQYYLSFAPTAYDRETGSLTVENCELTQSTSAGPRVVFSTHTVFRGGEYTVLGATGAKPMFVVVRLTPA